jgi:uncharacterized coiled-coil protein SlyX
MSGQETEFDEDQGLEDVVEGEEAMVEADEASESRAPVKKKSGGGLFFIILCLIICGGAFFGIRHLGGELPALVAMIKGEKPASAPSPATAPVVTAAPSAPAVTNVAADPLAQVTQDQNTANPLAAADGVALPSAVMLDPLSSAPPADAAAADVQQDGGLVVPPMPSGDTVETEKSPVDQDPLAATTSVAPVNEVAPVIAVNDAALSVPPQMPQDAPVVEQVAPVEAEKSVQQDILATPVLADASAAPETDQKLGDLESRLARLEGGLDEIKAIISSQNNTPVADVEALKESISALEQKISDLQRRPAQKTAVIAQPAPAPKSVVRKSGPATTYAAVQWQLKSAKPGKAWLSSAGSGEMTMVQTGDLLPGVGRVTAIEYDRRSGKWYVQIGTVRITE